MSTLTVNADALLALLQPELEHLCKSAPRYGVISIQATIHDGDVGRVSLGVEIARNISPRVARKGGNS